MSKFSDNAKLYGGGLASFGVWLGLVAIVFTLLPLWAFWTVAVLWILFNIRQNKKNKAALLQMGGYLMAQGIHSHWVEMRFYQTMHNAPSEAACAHFDEYLAAISEKPLGSDWTKKHKRMADKSMGDR